jgi:hypothetical protein
MLPFVSFFVTYEGYRRLLSIHPPHPARYVPRAREADFLISIHTFHAYAYSPYLSRISYGSCFHQPSIRYHVSYACSHIVWHTNKQRPSPAEAYDPRSRSCDAGTKGIVLLGLTSPYRFPDHKIPALRFSALLDQESSEVDLALM